MGFSIFIVCISVWGSSLVVVASLLLTVGSYASISIVTESSTVVAYNICCVGWCAGICLAALLLFGGLLWFVLLDESGLKGGLAPRSCC